MASLGAEFPAPDPGWWNGPDASRVKAELGQLSMAIDQVNGANLVTTWGARASACEALLNVSREGAGDPDNVNRVINWMLNDADGLRGEIDKIRGFAQQWSMARGADVMTQVFEGWLPDQIARTKCVEQHSVYLRDRINGVAASSGL